MEIAEINWNRKNHAAQGLQEPAGTWEGPLHGWAKVPSLSLNPNTGSQGLLSKHLLFRLLGWGSAAWCLFLVSTEDTRTSWREESPGVGRKALFPCQRTRLRVRSPHTAPVPGLINDWLGDSRQLGRSSARTQQLCPASWSQGCRYTQEEAGR